MKNLLTYCLLSLCVIAAQAQWIDSVRLTPTNLLDCVPFTVTAHCTEGCINSVINGSTISVSGSTITMDISVTPLPICLGAITFFSESQNLTVTAGTYTLNVNYVRGGSVTNTITRSLVVGSCCPADPSFTQNISGNICNGDSIMFSASSLTQNSYRWKVNGDSVGATTELNYTFSPSGQYTVTLITSDGTCDDSSSVNVNVGDYPSIVLDSIIDEDCAAANNGKVNISVSGGIPPYSFQWENGVLLQNQTLAPGGPIWVEVRDNYGCASRDTFVVGTGNGVTADFSFKDRFVLCIDDSLDLTNLSSGGNSFQWYQNGALLSVLRDLRVAYDSAGVYEMRLIAIEGACRDTASETLTAIEPGTLSANVTNPSCPGLANGEIDLTLTGGLSPYAYSWNIGSGMEDLTMLDSGTYSVLITDSALCRVQDTFRLDLLSNGIMGDLSFTRPNDTVYFRDLSDSTAVSWSWDFGDGSTSSLQNPAHVYEETQEFMACLTVTDAAGCMDTVCTTVNYTVGIEEELSDGINIFPNPFQDQLRISFENNLGEFKLSLYDLQGKLHISRSLNGVENILDLTKFQKGVYIMKLEGKSWTRSKVIIKQ
ncbi:MAG: PKD domain-containing protein [Bacteroidia bacterium]|nr:PKD domain-containing protein [Bacteroidia bacterium]